NVAGVGVLNRQPDPALTKLGAELGGMLSTKVSPFCVVAQLYSQNRCLQFPQTSVKAKAGMGVLVGSNVISQPPNLVVQIGIVGRDCSGIPIGLHVLRVDKAEAPNVPNATEFPSSVLACNGLAYILDNGKPVTPRKLEDPVHFGRLAVEMHGYHGASALGHQ